MSVRRWLAVAIVAPVVGLAFFPSSWLRATPTPVLEDERTAVVFGFGFERNPDGSMAPGRTNEFLLDWTLHTYPSLDTIFVQEGAWVSACAQSARGCDRDGVRLVRIDHHDDSIDLHTLDIAACAIERMVAFDRTSAVLVAHDLQLARAAGAMSRVAEAGLCPDCHFSVADVPDSPYPEQTAQWRTRSERLFRLAELAARVRFSAWLTPEAPQTCPSPMVPLGPEP